jgi:hypothetical protein
MKTLMPYPTLAGELTFKVTAAKLDGRDLPLEMISMQDRVVAVHRVERDAWEETRLEILAQLPEAELSKGPWSDVVCVAVLTEGTTNYRTVSRLRRSPDTRWIGSVSLPRDACRDRATLSVSAVATVDGVAGRIIGTADEDWVVDLSTRKPTRERELHIDEVDFRTGPHEWLRPFKDAPWLVETSGDMPTVYLNTGFEGVTDLLGLGGSPLEKAIRGMLAAQIATEAWIAMFHSAVSDVDIEDDGVPQWPNDWRDGVLRAMLPDVLPDLSPADALLEIHARRTEGSGWNELQPRIQYAASRRARVAKNLGIAIRTLGRSEEGSH